MILAFDIGGTSIKYGLIDDDRTFLHTGSIDTEAHLGTEQLVEKVLSIGDELKNEYPVEGIAIATAGMVDSKQGKIIHANENIPGYTGTEWKKMIEGRYSVPCEVENDSNCAGLAEAVQGAGKDFSHVLCVTVGTGIGSSLIIDQQIYHGASNQAMEIGYIPVKGEPFEKTASTTALIKRLAEKEDRPADEVSGRQVFAEAQRGNADYLMEIEDLIDRLAYGLSSVIYAVDPDVLVLGGGIMEQKDFLKPIIDRKFSAYLIPRFKRSLAIRFAESGNRAGMIGAYETLISKRF